MVVSPCNVIPTCARINAAIPSEMLDQRFYKTWDSAQQLYYYVNSATGETTWEQPTDGVIVDQDEGGAVMESVNNNIIEDENKPFYQIHESSMDVSGYVFSNTASNSCSESLVCALLKCRNHY